MGKMAADEKETRMIYEDQTVIATIIRGISSSAGRTDFAPESRGYRASYIGYWTFNCRFQDMGWLEG